MEKIERYNPAVRPLICVTNHTPDDEDAKLETAVAKAAEIKPAASRKLAAFLAASHNTAEAAML